ncbi:GtrA family protein [Nocardia sp. CDC159]|uniref:GtrA family protein n=1 Tax=Nocardia pulmonis TaxID=2951408 RepID=A0A9X2IXG0_9NOCA|nr:MULTISPECIES: GtrA family protein [Nocardia]MCM6775343.1 GtrA family protein [Nocardia pulmonis]MCM6787923.1 GtrA family protein [Nocardia sp. CDC159]
MSLVQQGLERVPERYRVVLLRHREMLKFAMVGGITWFVDTGIVYALKLTVLQDKPLTARAFGVLIATIVSYILNREWSFNARGGRQRHHEAALFFAVSGLAIVVTVIPQAVSLYVFDIRVPNVSAPTQAIANFVTGQILGVLLAMVFRFWALRRFVFPQDLREAQLEIL